MSSANWTTLIFIFYFLLLDVRIQPIMWVMPKETVLWVLHPGCNIQSNLPHRLRLILSRVFVPSTERQNLSTWKLLLRWQQPTSFTNSKNSGMENNSECNACTSMCSLYLLWWSLCLTGYQTKYCIPLPFHHKNRALSGQSPKHLISSLHVSDCSNSLPSANTSEPSRAYEKCRRQLQRKVPK